MENYLVFTSKEKLLSRDARSWR